ncbi:MAG: hypothetical protein QNJ31_09225 [Candidatus Caenarcaniphilales bacterium]|nr:hypothetical protein [Candidatus Caenarcaniphilales bacterium]
MPIQQDRENWGETYKALKAQKPEWELIPKSPKLVFQKALRLQLKILENLVQNKSDYFNLAKEILKVYSSNSPEGFNLKGYDGFNVVTKPSVDNEVKIFLTFEDYEVEIGRSSMTFPIFLKRSLASVFKRELQACNYPEDDNNFASIISASFRNSDFNSLAQSIRNTYQNLVSKKTLEVISYLSKVIALQDGLTSKKNELYDLDLIKASLGLTSVNLESLNDEQLSRLVPLINPVEIGYDQSLPPLKLPNDFHLYCPSSFNDIPPSLTAVDYRGIRGNPKSTSVSFPPDENQSVKFLITTLQRDLFGGDQSPKTLKDRAANIEIIASSVKSNRMLQALLKFLKTSDEQATDYNTNLNRILEMLQKSMKGNNASAGLFKEIQDAACGNSSSHETLKIEEQTAPTIEGGLKSFVEELLVNHSEDVNLKNASRILNGALKSNKSDPIARKLMAELLMIKRNTSEAVNILNQLVNEHLEKRIDLSEEQLCDIYLMISLCKIPKGTNIKNYYLKLIEDDENRRQNKDSTKYYLKLATRINPNLQVDLLEEVHSIEKFLSSNPKHSTEARADLKNKLLLLSHIDSSNYKNYYKLAQVDTTSGRKQKYLEIALNCLVKNNENYLNNADYRKILHDLEEIHLTLSNWKNYINFIQRNEEGFSQCPADERALRLLNLALAYSKLTQVNQSNSIERVNDLINEAKQIHEDLFNILRNSRNEARKSRIKIVRLKQLILIYPQQSTSYLLEIYKIFKRMDDVHSYKSKNCIDFVGELSRDNPVEVFNMLMSSPETFRDKFLKIITAFLTNSLPPGIRELKFVKDEFEEFFRDDLHLRNLSFYIDDLKTLKSQIENYKESSTDQNIVKLCNELVEAINTVYYRFSN